jgi:hypothetical protein
MNPANPSLSFRIRDFPDELLLNIIFYLLPTRGFLVAGSKEASEEEWQRKDKAALWLHSLTLTCRRFNKITTPYLYQSIIQQKQNFSTIPKLLRTFAVNPKLAEYVHYIESHIALEDVHRLESADQNAFFHDSDWPVLRNLLNAGKWNEYALREKSCSKGSQRKAPSKMAQLPPLYIRPGRDLDHLTDYIWRPKENFGVGLAAVLATAEKSWSSHERFVVGVTALLVTAGNLMDVALTQPAGSILTTLAHKEWKKSPKPRHLWLHDMERKYGYDNLCMVARYTQKDGAANKLLWPYIWRTDFIKASDGMSEPRAEIEELSVSRCSFRAFGICAGHLPLACRSLRRFSCRWNQSIRSWDLLSDFIRILFVYLGRTLLVRSSKIPIAVFIAASEYPHPNQPLNF